MASFADAPGLLAGFREGRREALELVYRENVRAVDNYVRALARASGRRELGRSGDVADLIQEIFVRVFSPAARRNYDGARDFVPYLMTIARNCFIDRLRVSGREVLWTDQELVRLADQALREPEEAPDARTLGLLNAYIRGLPEELKGVYEQRFVLGKSQEESSAALGISRRAVRTGEGRLRTGLRKALVRGGINLRDLPNERVDFPTRPAASLVRGGGGGA
jgi:RNA polymerase sigma-70 factor (ECF subfamily)